MTTHADKTSRNTVSADARSRAKTRSGLHAEHAVGSPLSALQRMADDMTGMTQAYELQALADARGSVPTGADPIQRVTTVYIEDQDARRTR